MSIEANILQYNFLDELPDWKTVEKEDTFNCIKNEDTTLTISYSDNLVEEFYKFSCSFSYAGYQVAAHLIRKNVNIGELDTMIFPLTFLLRHSIELKLKTLGLKYITDREEQKQFIKENFQVDDIGV